MTGLMREASIDLSAISRNVETLRAAAGTAHTMAVVKARGYGHGAVDVARAALAGGADWLGVADIREGLRLRAAGITAPILAWLHDPAEDFEGALAAGLEIGVSYLAQLERVAAASGTANVHIKVDTGLGRNGVEKRQWRSVFEAAARLEQRGAIRVRGLFSHLANAGRHEDLRQVAEFEQALQLAADAGLTIELRHLAATAGALAVPEARFDMVRLGIGIYGLSPLEGRTSAELGLVPAMQLSAAIASVKRVPAGSGVSYGLTHRTDRECTLALVPLGYADGVPRAASNRAPVSINGSTYRVAGTVAMDQFVVDLGDDTVSVGDRAVLFGDPADGVPSADDWAEASGTINYEIVTRLGGRIERTWG
ncbi:alanine racemase [Homoserinimonas aerilata]|uniref:Alanine racemase n=1 Tax=Homoserinimonas aerilata TaxID=1162970 RepID=A0A542YLC4_9MICO|nr:alanine racemase [Homoserinimonas aerilata]TQL48897.1 alanine racemase [Homoserinimonas aerilata]